MHVLARPGYECRGRVAAGTVSLYEVTLDFKKRSGGGCLPRGNMRRCAHSSVAALAPVDETPDMDAAGERKTVIAPAPLGFVFVLRPSGV